MVSPSPKERFIKELLDTSYRRGAGLSTDYPNLVVAAKKLSRLSVDELHKLYSYELVKKLDTDKVLQRATLAGLGRKIPLYLLNPKKARGK